MHVAIRYPEPDPVLEAGDGAAKRAQRAGRAGREVLGDRTRLERQTIEDVLKRMEQLRDALRQRLLAGDGGVTDFRRFDLLERLRDVDRLIRAAQDDLADLAKDKYEKAAKLGNDHAVEPLKAAQLLITRAEPGVDIALVQSAFGNTVDLLSPPMQQFGTDVKVAIRRVALAGDGRMEEIQRLRDKISGAGFEGAAFRAERIIRTEVGRTFNTATFDRLVTLATDFPFLRKGWRDSKDRRVRQGHIEAGKNYARGSGIPIAQPFKVNVYDERKGKAPRLIGVASLRYPVDPQVSPAGRLGAASTIMCRCNSFVDMKIDELAQFARAKVSTALGVKVPKVVAPPAAPEPPAKVRKVRPVKPKKNPLPAVKAPVIDDFFKTKDVIPADTRSGSVGFSGTYAADVQRAIEEAETFLRQQSVEHIFIFDPKTGTKLHQGTDNQRSAVTVPGHISMRGTVVTHNHPSNNAFSPQDLMMAVRHKPREVRAAVRGGTFRIFVSGDDLAWPEDIVQVARGVEYEVIAEFKRQILMGHMTIKTAERLHWRTIWERTAIRRPAVTFTFEGPGEDYGEED